MTANQVAYWQLQETKRDNVARLTESNRHNVAVENETVRHNTAQHERWDTQSTIEGVNTGINAVSTLAKTAGSVVSMFI